MAAICLRFTHFLNIAYHVITSSENSSNYDNSDSIIIVSGILGLEETTVRHSAKVCNKYFNIKILFF